MRGAVFSINVNGVPRKLLTVEERSNSGDLTLILKHGVYSTNLTGYSVEHNSEITRFTWSVHLAREQGKVPMVNFTAFIGTNPKSKTNSRYYTPGIDKAGWVAPVFYRRASDPTDERYLFKKDKTYHPITSLGEYDPKKVQLVYGVYVGKSDTNIFWRRRSGVNAVHTSFSRLRVAILWNFLPNPSDTTSDNVTLDNSNARMKSRAFSDTEREFIESFSDGVLASKMADDFMGARTYLRDLYIRKLQISHPTFLKIFLMQNSEFLLRGQSDALEYKTNMEKVRQFLVGIGDDEFNNMSYDISKLSQQGK